MAAYKWYGKTLEGIFNGGVSLDWDTDTIKVALVTSAYTPDQDAHDVWADVQANEVANGNGYTTGGATLAGKSVVYTGASNLLALIANDVTWAALTKDFRYAVVYKDTGNAATSPLVGYSDLGAQSITGVDFTLDHDPTNGLFKGTLD